MPSLQLPVPQLPSFLPLSLPQTNRHHRHHRHPLLQQPEKQFALTVKPYDAEKSYETNTTVEISITRKKLAFVSAAGGVATGSATRDPLTVTPDPSPETPLWIQKIGIQI